MLDHASFHALLADRLHELDGSTAVELHLHGGESFFLCRVRRSHEAYAVCEILPMHEGAAPRSSYIPVQEAAVPYTTIADLVVSARRFARDHPAGFRGVEGGAGVNGASPPA